MKSNSDNSMLTSPNQSPYEVTENRRRQRLVIVASRTLRFGAATMGTLLAGVYLIGPHWQVATIFASMLPILGVTLAAPALAQRNRLDVASHLLVVPVTVLICVDALVINGAYQFAAPAFGAMLVVAGSLLDTRQTTVVGTGMILLWLTGNVIQMQGWVNTEVLPGRISGVLVFAGTSLSLVVVGVISHAAIRDLRQGLIDANYDLVQANMQLAKATQLKSQHLTRMSHELRTPLNAINGFIDLTLRGLYGEVTDQQSVALNRSARNAQRLLALVGDILDLSKIESGQLELAHEPFAIKDVLDTVHEAIEPQAREKGLALVVLIAPGMPPTFVGDEGRVTQIVLNLAGNAVKFTAQGEVSVTVEAHGLRRWRVRVKDTGRGISEANMDRIFDEFWQAESARQEATGGVGLGLAISNQLAELMGGTLTASSRLGKGSEFVLDLPLVLPD